MDIARAAAIAAIVVAGTLGVAGCQHGDPSSRPTSSPGTPGTGQVQPQQGGPSGGSLPGLGTPFSPSGHSPTSLPPLSGGGS